MRVDRLLGEHGIGEDSAAGRREFESRMESRRAEESDEEALQPLRRGWCLGSEMFKQPLRERLAERSGDPHSGELRQARAEAIAGRIIETELRRLGGQESELAERRKTDPGKLALAARLRRETSLPLKWIAARGRLGTSKSANANRHHWRQAYPEPAITMQSGSATKGHETTKTNHPMG
jgi:hypothetical protein